MRKLTFHLTPEETRMLQETLQRLQERHELAAPIEVQAEIEYTNDAPSQEYLYGYFDGSIGDSHFGPPVTEVDWYEMGRADGNADRENGWISE